MDSIRDKPVAQLPLDLSHHFSQVTQHRLPSKIKEFYKFFVPGIRNLAGGLPNASFFPFDTLEAQVAKPERWTPSPSDPNQPTLAGKLALVKLDDTKAANHIVVPKASDQADPMKKIDLTTALQYGTAEGYPALRSFIRQFAREHLHPNVPYAGGPEVILTCGSTDGFAKTLELLTNHWFPEVHDVKDRQGLLVETFTYGNVLSQATPRGVQTVPVEMDRDGMLASGPGGLEDVLSNWDINSGKRPHFMYSVTMGQNPTGGVVPMERRREIYALCSKYDVIIVEDDPYWYLQYPSAEIGEANSRNIPFLKPTQSYKPAKSSGYPFIDSLVPSYLNIDTDGRVIRLDTFSKTIAPGCRLGWITAQPAIIERFMRITEATTQQPSGFVQSMVAEIVMGPQPAVEQFRSLSAKDRQTFTGWKMDGWVRWLAGLRGQYERRMNRMCTLLDEGSFQVKQSTPVRTADADWGVITKTQLYDFDWPRGGMFLWVRVNFEKHPMWMAAGINLPVVDGPALCTALMVYLTHKPYLVIVAPGLMFGATDTIRADRGWGYFRLCFAAESEENVNDGSQRFSEGVQKFWRIKSVEEIEKLVGEVNFMEEAQEMDGVGNFATFMGC